MELAKIAIEKRYLKYKLYIEHSTRQAHTRTFTDWILQVTGFRSYDRRLNTPITWANQLKHLKLAFFFFFHFFENPLTSSRNCNTHTYKTINQNQRWQMFTQFPLKFFFFSLLNYLVCTLIAIRPFVLFAIGRANFIEIFDEIFSNW